MSQNVTVWTVDDATNFFSTDENRLQTADVFRKSGYNVLWGDRTIFNADGGQADMSSINIMPSTEYFVPVAPKCIGSLFDTSDNETIQKIRDYYVGQSGQLQYTHFWEFEGRDYKMLTKQYMGYYEILRETAPNILVGYSQGGLVARYLLWLSHNVFNEPSVVKGIITVSSPNFGSPLANPDNTASIIFGFAKILCILFVGEHLADKIAAKIAPEISIDDIRGFFKSISQKLQDTDEKSHALGSVLTQLYDWLGGLRNDPNDAFYDLNIFRMDHPYSVITSISQSTPDNIQGLLSANNSLKEILTDAVMLIIWDEIKKCFKRKSNLNESLSGSPYNTARENGTKMESAECKGKISAIEEVINGIIMVEHPPKPVVNPVISRRIADYTQGTRSPQISAQDHDFVIPTVYQQTTAAGGLEAADDHNTVNYDANHLSGSMLQFSAGVENYNDILLVLPKLL